MLEIEGIHLKKRNKTILSSLTLRFLPGKLYAILGPNGSGKTSLLKVLNGTWQPTAGVAFWQGTPLHTFPRHALSQILSLVPQNPWSPFAFSVTDLVAMGTYALQYKTPSPLRRITIDEALKAVDAYHLKDEWVTELSTGERQRVYIARALVSECPVLLLDEPTSNLDIAHQLEIWALLGRLVQGERSIIVTSHDLSMCERFCDRVAVLHHGSCVGEGSPQQVLNEETLKSVFGVRRLTNGAPFAPAHTENRLRYTDRVASPSLCPASHPD